MQPEKLKIYNDLLVKWQKAINLVSKSTLPEARKRHFRDSEQLLQHIPEGVKVVVDLGSGAGFPGMVLAILNPSLEMHLIESDERKCQFLRVVSRETNTTVSIRNGRVEKVLQDLKPDLITARAFASLSEILGYTEAVWALNPQLELLLLKGQGVQNEIEEAQKKYRFESEFYPSETDPEARIIKISQVSFL